jgi:hypothetical protein
MVDEITTALSRFKSLIVIARNSSFTYKGNLGPNVVDALRFGRIRQLKPALGVFVALRCFDSNCFCQRSVGGQSVKKLTQDDLLLLSRGVRACEFVRRKSLLAGQIIALWRCGFAAENSRPATLARR